MMLIETIDGERYMTKMIDITDSKAEKHEKRVKAAAAAFAFKARKLVIWESTQEEHEQRKWRR